MNRTQTQRVKKQAKSSKIQKQHKQQKRTMSVSAEKTAALNKLTKMTTTSQILAKNKKKSASVESSGGFAHDESCDTDEHLYGKDFDPEAIEFENQDDSDREVHTPAFIKEDNAYSFHPPVFSASPLKVNIANIFDSRADYTGATRHIDLRLEIGHDGRNIQKDLDEKTEWMDSHITNNWLDTCITRYCVSVSKKAKQQKPSNSRQAKARKMHKQTGEKRLAASIRSAIDNTPRFSGFAAQLAQNQQIHGTYSPDHEEFEHYRDTGTARSHYLQQAGTDPKSRHRVLRSLRDVKGV